MSGSQTAPGPVAGSDHALGASVDAIDDEAFGKILVRGTLLGFPLAWVLSALMMWPLGLKMAFVAGFFVAVAAGPFLGASILLMRRLLQLDRLERASGAHSQA
jgi:hypothetical protein